MMTSFQARRNIFARLCLEGRSCGSVQTNRDETEGIMAEGLCVGGGGGGNPPCLIKTEVNIPLFQR